MEYKRRDFLKTTTTATAALLFSSLEGIALANEPQLNVDGGFELKILATNWGFIGSVDSFCKKVKDEGYDGIELWWPKEKQQQEDLFAALEKYKLDVGFLCGGVESDPSAHLRSFKAAANAAAHSPHKPLFINCHSGKDYFSYEENKAFIDYTSELSKETGIPVYHETHRGRMLFAAQIARQYIEKNPDLRLTLDVSHWCNVSESFLKDQQDTLALAINRVDHIHARIGHPEGPQVNDPRAPEWTEAVKVHFAFWDEIVARKKKEGKRLTILTEFGPPGYMPVLPYTRQPVADQWSINVYMMHLLRKRYG